MSQFQFSESFTSESVLQPTQSQLQSSRQSTRLSVRQQQQSSSLSKSGSFVQQSQASQLRSSRQSAQPQLSAASAQLSRSASVNLSQAANPVSRIINDLIELQKSRQASARLSAGSARQSPAKSAAVASRAYNTCGGQVACVPQEFLSEVEQSILRAQVPLELSESDEISVNGERGLWANKQEVVNWRGVIPIGEYCINEDANPEIITKKAGQQLEYVQELAIRYLRPPTPPAPGEIIINQECNTLTPPAPPL